MTLSFVLFFLCLALSARAHAFRHVPRDTGHDPHHDRLRAFCPIPILGMGPFLRSVLPTFRRRLAALVYCAHSAGLPFRTVPLLVSRHRRDEPTSHRHQTTKLISAPIGIAGTGTRKIGTSDCSDTGPSPKFQTFSLLHPSLFSLSTLAPRITRPTQRASGRAHSRLGGRPPTPNWRDRSLQFPTMRKRPRTTATARSRSTIPPLQPSCPTST